MIFFSRKKKELVLIDYGMYKKIWNQFGGSFITNPIIVARISDILKIKVRYFGWERNGNLIGAIPTWGSYIACYKHFLKKQKQIVDFGSSEFILPIAQNEIVTLHHNTEYISLLNKNQILNIKYQNTLALAKSLNKFSKKSLSNKNSALRKLINIGGSILPIMELNSNEQAKIYSYLFIKRWGFEVPGKRYLKQIFESLREYMYGNYIILKNNPIAIQILYKVESLNWIHIEYINGGLDPKAMDISAGSVLSFFNIKSAFQEAEKKAKKLRYSFGLADQSYKYMWCETSPVFKKK